ncbi:hypothetical protein SAMN05660297_00945 [Natronincola peptidivorans]|uniref:Uncharacterized protein n=1 Tax=Natronincola peptidivorans TaxID=426128 RepID=A0A1I0AJ23_9FIRM|nr:hypothetical protein SAMN05660297_00945 [Natronincola peptidivorans]
MKVLYIFLLSTKRKKDILSSSINSTYFYTPLQKIKLGDAYEQKKDTAKKIQG